METAPAVSAEEAAAFAAIEQLEAAEAALTLTHEQEAAEIAAIEQRAEEHGTNEKSGGVHGNVGSMRRKLFGRGFVRLLSRPLTRAGRLRN